MCISICMWRQDSLLGYLQEVHACAEDHRGYGPVFDCIVYFLEKPILDGPNPSLCLALALLRSLVRRGFVQVR